jgi:ADP-heptose:LPS heptosyltransferase
MIWASSSWDPTRSLQLKQLVPLASLARVELFSLQQGAEAAEVQEVPFAVEPLSTRTAGALEAAAAMLELDAIVTVDSMPAHLAGALGCPVFLLLQHRADWRWMEGRSDSPWYPTMRIFRQPAPGDWAPAVERLAEALRSFKAGLSRAYRPEAEQRPQPSR